MPNLCLNKEVAQVIAKGENIVDIDSPSLRLFKYVRIKKATSELPPKPGKYADKQVMQRWQAIKNAEDSCKKNELEAVCRISERLNPLPPPTTRSFYSSQENVRAFSMRTGSRLMVDMAKGFHENANICLHRHFGYPFIPGSAVKGCAAHCAWELWNESEDESQKLRIAKQIACTFGFPTNDKSLDSFLKENGTEKDFSGTVIFMPAIPWGVPAKLCVDVLTPHHTEYYNGNKKVATDDETPVPSFFLAVESDSVFRFAIRAIPGRSAQDDLDFAEKMLKKALTENGIGAKTAAGYGWFHNEMEI